MLMACPFSRDAVVLGCSWLGSESRLLAPQVYLPSQWAGSLGTEIALCSLVTGTLILFTDLFDFLEYVIQENLCAAILTTISRYFQWLRFFKTNKYHWFALFCLRVHLQNFPSHYSKNCLFFWGIWNLFCFWFHHCLPILFFFFIKLIEVTLINKII